MEIFNTDIRDKKEFKFEGDTLKQYRYDEKSGKWIYKRFFPSGVFAGYEIVKPVKRKNPDGNIVHCYPTTEQFGHYGWFLPPRSTEADIQKYLDI